MAFTVKRISVSESFLCPRIPEGKNLPQIKLIEPEGTYLIWLDFGELGLGRKELEALIDQAGLWLDAGAIFGKTGIGFERINTACPRKTLEQAFLQLKKSSGCVRLKTL